MQYYRLTTTTKWIPPAAVMIVLLIVQSPFSTAAPPASPSDNKLKQIDSLSTTNTDSHNQRQKNVETTIKQSDEQSAVADKKMRSFLKRSNQAQQANKGSSAKPNQTPPPASKKETADNKKADTEEEPATIKIKCDGGIYFDNENGILTYLKNIRLDESNSAFKLRCDDELKILFNNKPKKKKQNTSAKKTDVTQKNQADQSANSFSSRGDLKEIIASGNVRITGENNDGQSFLASGNTASYNAKTGEMILKGGRPTLQQSANEYLQAAEDGQWIRLIMRDKDIESIITSQGKWVMQAVPKK
ncbi:MAG: hypothetical protein P8P36_03085 [Akkermansiaceae bacterium]|nr:hypothetical protein [Akkermansiaceae bacterium]